MPAAPFCLIYVLVCHLLGALQFGLVTSRNFPEAFLAASLPYIPKDVVSVVIAYILARTLRDKLNKSSFCAEKA